MPNDNVSGGGSAMRVGEYRVKQESRDHGHVIAPDGSGFCTAPIANCHTIARLLNTAAERDATEGSI